MTGFDNFGYIVMKTSLLIPLWLKAIEILKRGFWRSWSKIKLNVQYFNYTRILKLFSGIQK